MREGRAFAGDVYGTMEQEVLGKHALPSRSAGMARFIKEGEARTAGTGSREGTESGNGTPALKS